MTLADFSLGSRKRTQWWIPWKVTTREQSDQLNVSMIHGSWRASSRACSPELSFLPLSIICEITGRYFFLSFLFLKGIQEKSNFAFNLLLPLVGVSSAPTNQSQSDFSSTRTMYILLTYCWKNILCKYQKNLCLWIHVYE